MCLIKEIFLIKFASLQLCQLISTLRRREAKDKICLEKNLVGLEV
jgi:hypothetical protein